LRFPARPLLGEKASPRGCGRDTEGWRERAEERRLVALQGFVTETV